MKAAYYTGNHTFAIEEVAPQAPAADQITVDVAYCGICGTDLHAYHGKMDARITTHRVIGHEMSGVIAAVGANVTDVTVGDRVAIRPLAACGNCPACKAGHSHVCHNLKFLGLDTDGAFQNQWNVPADTVHKLPDAMTLEHAALVEPTAVACHDVTRANVQPGEDVLVIGGGPIGMLVAMVAKHAGANVTLSEVSEHRLAMAKDLGFATVNPVKEDLVAAINAQTGNKGADVVFEVSGTQPGVDAMTETVACRGRIVMVAIHAERPQVDLFKFFWREFDMLGARLYQPADFDKAIQLISDGVIDCKAMITDVRDLDQIGDAFAALSENPKAMKSLIKCA